MRPLPAVLRLSRAAVERADRMRALVARRLRPTPAACARAFAAFAFKNDERQFALQVLRERPQLWLFRSNQRAYCGDFVIVDMSSPRRERRPAFVVDLKQGAALRAGRGVGMQLAQATRAIAEVARSCDAVPAESAFELLCGDASEVLRFLGGRPR
jgi:hypothetical protein